MNRIRTTFLSLFVFATSALAAPNILSIKNTITDSAIVYPESFETDTHQMLKNWYLKNYTVLETDFSTKTAKGASDDVYIDRLSRIPTTIEMPYNQIVRSYINMYVERRRQLVENMLGMSLYYMPIFEQALERKGLPLELRYLPIIESAMNPDAVSRAGAVGLWQMMMPTARGLGLEINTLVDERRDPIASSEAAATYLKQLYDMYGDWSLAIAAYNCGPGNVNKALRRAGGDKNDFWSIYYYLPQETRGYVPAFIAANYVMAYYKEHGISPALARKPIITDSVHVNQRVHFRQISDVLNIPVEEIRVLNPQYRKDIIPGDTRSYSLVLPSMQVYSYIMSQDSIVSHDASLYNRRTTVEPTSPYASNGEYTTKLVIKRHKVARGETFSSIAKKYGVTISEIKKWNGIKAKTKTLARGKILKIHTYERVPLPKKEEPDSIAIADAQTIDSPASPADSTALPTDSTTLVSPTVEPTETEVIEQQPQDEPAAEPAKPAKAEKKVTKSTPEKKKPVRATAKTHIVRKGETLYKIAAKYKGVTVNDIKRANNITGSNIKIGQKLKIPAK
ncbi:MAG: transglycosylase SLT domain-containing protein [Muribaculum sp.]|nr:transglycosylase SLT domain-containing protein [Muribaculaceae bacterium]MCM1080744.1 transglycosylase SLT domain-containing protein [Muribaculum sp.]